MEQKGFAHYRSDEHAVFRAVDRPRTRPYTRRGRRPRWRPSIRPSTPRRSSAIRGGDALLPTATGVITSGPRRTGGPTARSSKALAKWRWLLWPEARKPRRGTDFGPRHPGGQGRRRGGVRRRLPRGGDAATRWIPTASRQVAEPPDRLASPGLPSAECDGGPAPGVPRRGGPAHQAPAAGLHPPSTATTVRVRDGEVIETTDGPYAEGAEVANGFLRARCR